MQAITGALIVFHWEVSDFNLSRVHRPTDLAAIERRLNLLAPVDGAGRMREIWATGGLPDRYEVSFQDNAGKSQVVYIAGDGSIIHMPRYDETTLMSFLVGFHHHLLGAWGSWIVSISGVLLCSNLILGLIAAWPRGGTWRVALKPSRRGPATARLYSWHRAVGLWAVVPALIIAGTGTIMKFEDGFGRLIGATPVSLPLNPVTGPPVGFASVASSALAAIPRSRLTMVSWPEGGDATYRVRVRAPGEMRRAYGGSLVFVDANTGAVRGVYPIAQADPARAFMSALFPIHTGEAGGLFGRLLCMAIGLWLITMSLAGILLWVRRRKRT